MTDTPPVYARYPLVMTHPGFRPATLGTSPDERKHTPGHAGTPIKFPPVTVHDQVTEDYHAAQGYVVGHMPNPGAFEAAFAAPDPGSQEFAEFPKMVGKRVVNGPDEEAEAIRLNAEEELAEAQRLADEAARAVADGADDVRDEVAALKGDMADIKAMLAALLAKPADPAPSASTADQSRRAALEQDAAELGIKVDGRWSLAKLQSVVDEALKGKEP